MDSSTYTRSPADQTARKAVYRARHDRPKSFDVVLTEWTRRVYHRNRFRTFPRSFTPPQRLRSGPTALSASVVFHADGSVHDGDHIVCRIDRKQV